MIIGTAGHIDHGKTSLVRSLTGVDTDRLKEEKARGISIELGYAYQQLESGGVLGFVDVPGHERFVHTMLAGATGIDFALLVIAADDGVMPQTREHLQILELLGVASGAVALTKIDRVDQDRVQAVQHEIEQLLSPTPLRGSPLFEVSNATGSGIEELRQFLHGKAMTCGERSRSGHFRLAVDRSFTLAGAGTVVTGTVFSGVVKVDDELRTSPSGLPVRVRSIHAQGRAANEGKAGERCALSLSGIAKDQVRRGDWIVAPAIHAPAMRIDTRIRVLPSESRPLKHWARVHLHLGAAHATARVALLDSDALAPGQTGLAQLVLDEPIGALCGDLFIVRDAAASRTLGGGKVIDPFGPARYRRSEQRRAVLAALEVPDASAALARLLGLSPAGLDLTAFARARNLKNEQGLAPASAVLVRREGASLSFSAEHWRAWGDKTLAALREFHARSKNELGPELQRLRLLAAPQLAPAAWTALIEDLCAQGLVIRKGPLLHLAEHRAALSTADEVLAQKILPKLESAGFDPPWVRDMAKELRVPEQQLRSLMMRLVKQGLVFQVVDDLFYPSATVIRLSRIAAELEKEQGGVLAAQFRDRTQLGRKRAIQILEFFDRVGYTRRVRDEHRLRGADPFGASAPSPPSG